MKRRRSLPLVAGLLASVVGLAGCSVGMGGAPSSSSEPSATGAFSWKRFSGATIDVMLDQHPWTTGLQKQLAAFTDATGIHVNIKSYSEDLYFDKMNQALRSSTPPDVFMTGLDYTVATQHAGNLLEPLTPYINDPSLTSSDYDLSDYPSGVLAPAKFTSDAGEQLFGIPVSTETYILFYNKDLVNKYLGGKVPSTMPELISDAAKITSEGGGQVYGSVVRGVRNTSIVDTPTAFVFNEWPSSAGEISLPYNVWFDGSWTKPRMTDPAVVSGLQDYASLLASGPPNKFNIDWSDANALFSQGKVAFYADASVFGPTFEDATKSAVAGKVGYATLPVAASGGTSGLWSWGLAISKASQQKGAAWLFTQWFTNKANTAKLGAYTGGPPRQSAATMSDYTSALNPDYIQTVTKSLATARPTAVIKADIEPVLLEIVDTVLAIAQGTDAKQATAAAQTKMKTLVK